MDIAMKKRSCPAFLLACLLFLCTLFGCTPAHDPDPSAADSSPADSAAESLDDGHSNADPDYPADSADDSSAGVPDTSSRADGSKPSPSADSSRPAADSSSGNSNGNGGNKPAASMPYFNVKNYGAKADGKTDDSGALKKAVAAAQKANGGLVYLPAGRYRLASGIDVPMGVSIRGESPSTRKKWRKPADLGQKAVTYEAVGTTWTDGGNLSGTWILVDHGAGNADAHATFQLEGNASVYGLGFLHLGSAPVTDKITVYPPAIAIKNTKDIPFTRDGMTIEDICLLNAYIGIGIQAGNGKLLDHEVGSDANLNSLGRMRVHNVTGGCVYRGMILKGLLDTVDLQNVRFGHTNLTKTYMTFRARNAADFEWYRADGSNVSDIASYGAKYGVLSTPAYKNGSTSLRMTNAELVGRYPLYLTASGQYEISDCTLVTADSGQLADEKAFCAMTVIQDETSIHQPFYLFCRLTLENRVQSASAEDRSLCLITKRASAAAMVLFSELTFKGWSPDSADPLIYYEAAGTSYGGYALFNSCKAIGGSSAAGLLYKAVNIAKGGLQFNNCTFPQGLIDRSARSDTVWFQ